MAATLNPPNPLQRWALIGLGSLCFVFLRGVGGPEFLYSGDPGYLYLYNGFNPLHGLPYYAVDHPGVPLLVLSTVLLWLTGITPEALYGCTELFLGGIFAGVVLLRAASLWYMSRRLPLWAFACVALYPLFLGASFGFARGYSPDLFAHLLGPWLCYFLLKPEHTRRDAAWAGALLGVAVVLKLPFLLLVPMVLLWQPRFWRVMAGCAGLAALLGSVPLWPVIPLYASYVWGWVGQAHGYLERPLAEAWGAGVGAVAVTTSSFVFPVLLWLTRHLKDRLWWWSLGYCALLVLVALRWGEARHVALISVLLPLAYQGLLGRTGARWQMAFALVFVVGALHLSLAARPHREFKCESPVVLGYKTRSWEYAMMFGHANSGGWLPRPPVARDRYFAYLRAAAPDVPFPIAYHIEGRSGVASSAAELRALLPDLRTFSFSPEYRAWFRERRRAAGR